MPADPYQQQRKGVVAISASLVDVITPSDDDDLPYVYQYIFCGATEGAVAFHDAAGAVSSPMWANAGQALMFVPRRILATGTDATPLFGVRDVE
jgi:hypothetical protein